MKAFHSLSQIDYGELEQRVLNGIKACVDDIFCDQDQLTRPRQVAVTIKLTPDENGNIDITYDVTTKLAKREGVVRAYVDKTGMLILGDKEQQEKLPGIAEIRPKVAEQ